MSRLSASHSDCVHSDCPLILSACLEEHVVQCFSPPSPSFNASTNAETSSNLFETYDIAADLLETVPSVPSFAQSSLPASHENNSTTVPGLFPVQKLAPAMKRMDHEETTQTIIMDHLHSVQSLKKFFETKMVTQGPAPISTSSALVTSIAEQKSERSSIANEPKPMDRNEQRQEMMNKVLESMKRKKAYSRTIEGKHRNWTTTSTLLCIGRSWWFSRLLPLLESHLIFSI